MMTEMPPGTILSFDANTLATLGIQLLNVAIVMVVLIKVLYNPVKKFMQNREAQIKTDLDAAAADRLAASEEKATYQKQLARLDVEREEILGRVHARALEKSDKVIAEAQQKAAQILQQARAQAQLERRQEQAKIKEQVIDLSTLIAGKYVDMSLDAEGKQALVERAFQDLEEGA